MLYPLTLIFFARFEVLLDPSSYEESLSKSQHVFAFAFSRDLTTGSVDGTLVYNDSRGSHSREDYQDVMSLCREASKNILETVRASISQSL
jgi:ribonuclease PH